MYHRPMYPRWIAAPLALARGGEDGWTHGGVAPERADLGGRHGEARSSDRRRFAW